MVVPAEASQFILGFAMAVLFCVIVGMCVFIKKRLFLSHKNQIRIGDDEESSLDRSEIDVSIEDELDSQKSGLSGIAAVLSNEELGVDV